MNGTKLRAARRRRIAVIAAVLVVLALALVGTTLAGVGSALAGEREDAVTQQEESKKRISSLKSSLAGIDEELQDLFTQMEQTRADVSIAEGELVVAQETLAAAERQLQQVADQLEDAEALMEELQSQIEEGKSRENDLTQAVGSMAREMYRGDQISPLEVVVNTEDLGEISSRAAAASALSRAQSKALDDVRAGIITSENQSQKQEAVTQRIADLKVQAEEAALEAAAAEAEVSDRLDQLVALQEEQTSAQERWEAQKGEAEAQLRSANSALEESTAKIAAIDLEREKARLEAEKSKASTSSASPPPVASSSGAILGSPLRIPLRVTSSFGYRIHPVFGTSLLHDGVDLGASCGTPQYSARAGTVLSVGYNSRSGNYVQVNHGVIGGHSYITFYGHASSIPVSAGQQVGTDTVVAYTGTTGASTGCHLHFSLFRDGVLVNPLDYM